MTHHRRASWPIITLLVGGLLACSGLVPTGSVATDDAVVAPATDEPTLVADPAPSEGAPAPGAEPAPAADPAPAAAPGVLPGGVAERLGLPKGDGTIVEETAKSVTIVHRAAFDFPQVWSMYDTDLVAAGWVRAESQVPPYESIYQQGREYVDVRMTMGGPSVLVEIDLKRGR